MNILDLVGIGIGPSNLSIAALLDQIPKVRFEFFDKKPTFSWHPGLMLPNAKMQTSYLKDLVTGVSPTSPYSFLSFLVEKKRFYQFINAEFDAVQRSEFAEYYAWVASKLSHLNFNNEVNEVIFSDQHFRIKTKNATYMSKHICVGTGIAPRIPNFATPFMSDTCFHANDIAIRKPDLTGKDIVIAGGGQTGAEVFLSIFNMTFGKPNSIKWISRRPNLEPLDETPFSNEYFSPEYVKSFFPLEPKRKQAIVDYQKLTSDGISPCTLNDIYRAIYNTVHLNEDRPSFQILPNREIQTLEKSENYSLSSLNNINGNIEEYSADTVILCTGFKSVLPNVLDGLKESFEYDPFGNVALDHSYQVKWDGSESNTIYAVNAGRFSHGIADSQTSLMCWRSGRIINNLLGRDYFDIEHEPRVINWTNQSAEVSKIKTA